MAADPSLVIRVLANNAELKRVMKESQGILATTESQVQKLANSLRGEQLTRKAASITEALARIGKDGIAPTAAEAARLEPILAKAIAKLEASGKGSSAAAESFRQAQQQLKGLADSAQQIEPKVGLLSSTWGRLVSAFSVGQLAANAVSFVTGKLTELAGQATKLEGLRNSYERLSNSMKVDSGAMLEALKTGTRGLVQEFDLLQSANKAMLLGLPVSVQSMGDMAQAATRLGKAMGLDATTALDNLITALGRVSPLILDNLGLTVKVEAANEAYAKSLGKSASALSEAEKKMAFYTAAMEAARKKSAELGEDTLTLSELMNQAWTSIADGATSLMSYLNTTLGEGMQRLGDHALYMMGRIRGMPIPSANDAEAMRIMAREGVGPRVSSPFSHLTPGIKSADDALRAFNQTHGETFKRMEKNITAAEKYREKVNDIKKSILGVSEAQKAQRQAEGELFAERKWVRSMLDVEDQTGKVLKATEDWRLSLKSVGVEVQRTADKAHSALAKTLAATPLPMGQMSNSVLFGGAKPLSMDGISTDWFVPALKAKLQSAAAAFPQMLSAAILHGQSLTQALRATVVDIGGSLGKMWGESLSKSSKMSSALGSLFSAGAAIGLDFLMKGVGALINKFKNVTKEGREGLAGELGFDSLDALYKRLQAMGPEGARLAHIGLNVIGKQDKAANEKWMKDVQAFLGKASADQDRLASAMEKYGFSWEQMGQKARNAKIGEIANDLLETFRVLTDPELGGIAPDEVLNRMAGDFSSMVQQAKRSATEIPAALRPTLQRLADMGLLLDENGEAIRDLNSLEFAKTMTQGFEMVRDAVYELITAITGIPHALTPTMDSLGVIGRGGGSIGSDGNPIGGQRGGTPININLTTTLDGQVLARNQLRWLPQEASYQQLS